MKSGVSDNVLVAMKARDSLKFDSSLFSLSQDEKQTQGIKQASGISTKDTGNAGDNNKSSCFDAVLCLHCGYKWRPRIKNPKCCPACKAYRAKGRRRLTIKIVDEAEE
jgi:rubrerythrin